jgi:histidinol-phosphate/aromatic aminotransferase/cobyric acid decarboxylase-like protein
LPWIESFPQLVILRSLTKFFTIPGLRIGFAVGHPERLRRWQQWRDPWSVNGLATVAALAALQDHEFVRQTHAWLPVARQHLRQGLQRLPGYYPFPSAANFLLVRLDQRGSDLQRVLLQKDQILIRDCLSFAQLGDNYIRVAVRSIAEQERLLAACQNDPA